MVIISLALPRNIDFWSFVAKTCRKRQVELRRTIEVREIFSDEVARAWQPTRDGVEKNTVELL